MSAEKMTTIEAFRAIRNEFDHYAQTGRSTRYAITGICLAVKLMWSDDLINYNTALHMHSIISNHKRCSGFWFHWDQSGARLRVAELDKIIAKLEEK
jgi:hypothetical protein